MDTNRRKCCIIAQGIFIICFVLFPYFLLSQSYSGIDVSHHNGKINWKEVAKDSNIKFVYIKATTGSTHTDDCYAYNIKNARENGLKVGSYHFFTSYSSAHKQFENFKSVAKKASQDLIPMVYSGQNVYNKYLAPRFNKFHLMLGNYNGTKPVIHGAGHYTIWQYSETGKIKGIPEKVDLSCFHKDYAVKNISMPKKKKKK